VNNLPSERPAKIQVKNVVKHFGKVAAVDDVSFDVREGEVVGLLGPSGCGKTTMLRSISGLEDIEAGEILIDGKVLSSPAKRINVPPEKRKVGFVFQSYALWPHMTVKANLAYALKGMTKKEKEKRIAEALELVRLSEVIDRYPAQLSGGQQQRVALARGLCYQPSVILLDEPMSNLDLRERERVRGELRKLLKEIGITSVFVTHDQEEAFVVSDRVVLLNHGKVVQEGSPNDLYSKPVDLFAAQFIGRANILKAEVVAVNPVSHMARIKFPELSTELSCEFEDDPSGSSMAAIRFNEISINNKTSERQGNVVEGSLVSREYRGSVTDHRIKVGGVELVVTTHKFCSSSEHSPVGGTMRLYIPPSAIRPLKG
jgi:ABC-type Fe3+/spermidine/putrescine transport system ATPase subunit